MMTMSWIGAVQDMWKLRAKRRRRGGSERERGGGRGGGGREDGRRDEVSWGRSNEEQEEGTHKPAQKSMRLTSVPMWLTRRPFVMTVRALPDRTSALRYSDVMRAARARTPVPAEFWKNECRQSDETICMPHRPKHRPMPTPMGCAS